MTHKIDADYRQQFILPPRLDDWIPSDHPARFIRDFVDSLDLVKLGFETPENDSEQGRPYYSSGLLLKIWIYGYFKKIRSCRKLEEACYDNMGFIWLTGRLTPDHNTIWRFFNKNKKPIRKIFRKVTLTALDCNLIGFTLHALDGSKIQSLASSRNGKNRKDLVEKLKLLDEHIKKVIEETEYQSSCEQDGYSMPEPLKDARERKRKIEEVLDKLKNIDRDNINLQDEETRLMKCGRVFDFAYNSQAVVDKDSQLIVAQDVTNEEYDNHQLIPMVEKVKETVGNEADVTVADGGYYAGETLKETEEKGLEVLVNIPGNIKPKDSDNKYHKSNFVYEPENDTFICPLGKALTFERLKDDRQKRNKLKVYRCKHFRECPECSNCSKEKRGRSIEMPIHYDSLLRHIEKHEETGQKENLKSRGATVEPVFGIIKEIFGFRRYTMHGLENVKTQWSLVCTSYNLFKLFKHWKAKRLFFI